MAKQKKPLLSDLRKEMIKTLEKLNKLESNFRGQHTYKEIKTKSLGCDISFNCKSVETEISVWENIDVTFTTYNGIRIRIELSKEDALSLSDYLSMDSRELEYRENSNNEEEENEDEE